MNRASTLVLGALAGLVAIGAPRDAGACGGVFQSVPAIETPGSRSIVRDHRMAIAIGRERTVVWDEVRLEGDPRDFVWISPVKQGTKIELADDEWLSALDVSTQPVVYGPRYASNGCALAGCAADQDTSTAVPGGSVFVVKEEVLGPYDSVVVRAAGDPDAPYRWLVENGYKVDDDKVRAMLASYAQAGFDFAALKLHATCNQTSMQPVRIVIPGSDPRILVRMALAGARIDLVPITLFVLGEAPYRPANYPFAFLDDDRLEWDRTTRSSSSFSSSATDRYYAPRSNYDEVANETMAREGKTWLIESAARAQLAGEIPRTPTPGLYEAYEALCAGTTPREASYRSTSPSSSVTATPTVKPPCPTVEDAGRDADDAGNAGEDAGEDAGDDAGEDAGNDAGDDAGDDAGADAATDAGGEEEADAGATNPPSVPPPRCKSGSDSDYALATRDVIGAPKIYVTRLRARIQPNALALDLDLTPATGVDARDVSNLHQVARYEDETDRPNQRACATSRFRGIRGDRAPAATWALGAAAALGLTAWLRRKNRR